MHTVTPRPVPSRSALLLSMQVDGETCGVRATAVWPIGEVLSCVELLEGFHAADIDADDSLIADAIESRMIVAPRLRRRQRAVSSRAALLAGE
ncbi:MAG: hypothetical protein ACKO4T_09945 [Planctomycetaceae bacterium]